MRRKYFFILFIVSFAVHFAFFGHPNETVFDEVHFGKFVSAYYTGQYYFDIHPPGGKLIIAGFAKLFDFKPEYSFAQIGQTFPDNKYLSLRFLPSLAGALLAIIIFFLALELNFSVIGAFTAGMFIALENALLTQSRYILLDPFLLLFGFTGLLFYFRARKDRRILNWLLAGIFFGLSTSIKWTGLGFMGLAGLIALFDWWRSKFSLKQFLNIIIYFLAIPFAIYYSVFAIHFALLYKSGDGDAFMTPAFQRTLQGSYYTNDVSIKPLNEFQKFLELNKEMYEANKTLTATHPYGSKWYTWPFMIRPIYYWNSASSASPNQQKIYLLGNPLVWWASTIAILYLLLELIGSSVSIFKKKNYSAYFAPAVIAIGWLGNYLPFIKIARVMFLYHYLAALVFAILALAYLLDQSFGRAGRRGRIRIWICIGIAALSFLYFAPLSYGLPLSPQAFQNRMWLTTWQ